MQYDLGPDTFNGHGKNVLESRPTDKSEQDPVDGVHAEVDFGSTGS